MSDETQQPPNILRLQEAAVPQGITVLPDGDTKAKMDKTIHADNLMAKIPYNIHSGFIPFNILDNPDPVMQLEGGKGPAIYEDMTLDTVIDACWSKIINTITGFDWEILPATENSEDKKRRDFIDDAFRKMNATLYQGQRYLGGFSAFLGYVVDGIRMGYTIPQAIWNLSEGRIAQIIQHIPQAFTFKDANREGKLVDAPANKSYGLPTGGGKPWFSSMWTAQDLFYRPSPSEDWQPAPAYKFIHCVYRPQYNDPWGRSQFRGAYWPYVFGFLDCLKWWSIFLDKWASPAIVYMADQVNWNKPEFTNAILRVIANMQQSYAAVLPKIGDNGSADDVKIIETNRSSTHSVFKDFFDTMNRLKCMALVGSPLLMMEAEYGTRAQSQTQAEYVHQDFIKGFCDYVMAQVQIPIVWMCDVRFGRSGKTLYPTFKLKYEPPSDLVQELQVDTNLQKMGFKFAVEDIEERYNRNYARPDEQGNAPEILEPSAPQPQQPPQDQTGGGGGSPNEGNLPFLQSGKPTYSSVHLRIPPPANNLDEDFISTADLPRYKQMVIEKGGLDVEKFIRRRTLGESKGRPVLALVDEAGNVISGTMEAINLYSEDQPRVPAGSPEGGQFSGANAGGVARISTKGKYTSWEGKQQRLHPGVTPEKGENARDQIGQVNYPEDRAKRPHTIIKEIQQMRSTRRGGPTDEPLAQMHIPDSMEITSTTPPPTPSSEKPAGHDYDYYNKSRSEVERPYESPTSPSEQSANRLAIEKVADANAELEIIPAEKIKTNEIYMIAPEGKAYALQGHRGIHSNIVHAMGYQSLNQAYEDGFIRFRTDYDQGEGGLVAAFEGDFTPEDTAIIDKIWNNHPTLKTIYVERRHPMNVFAKITRSQFVDNNYKIAPFFQAAIDKVEHPSVPVEHEAAPGVNEDWFRQNSRANIYSENGITYIAPFLLDDCMSGRIRIVMYDENQPRDERGRWTDVGGGGASYDRAGYSHNSRLKDLEREGAKKIAGYSERARVDREGVIHTDDVDDAVFALHEGRKVELYQPREVSTLLDRLRTISADMIKKGGKAPNFNLCNVSVQGTNLFCAGNLEIERIKMPQIENTDTFLEGLKSRGITFTQGQESAAYMRATQNQLRSDQVSGIATSMQKNPKLLTDKPIIVSKEGYVLDGHHRWAAAIGLDTIDGHLGDLKMPVIRVDLSIVPLLDIANKYSGERAGMDTVPSKPQAFADMWKASLQRWFAEYKIQARARGTPIHAAEFPFPAERVSSANAELRAGRAAAVPELDALFRRDSIELSQNMVVLRGWAGEMDELANAQAIVDRGFVPIRLAMPETKNIARIVLPKGTRVMFANTAEYDLLLPRGSKFLVHEIADGIIRMELCDKC